ncbi:MAG: hypothetical protein ACYC0V_17350 [Armatimonadota bacterium]
MKELLVGNRWNTIVEVTIPGHGAVRVKERWWKTRLQYEYSLQWYISTGNSLDYFIWTGGNRITQQMEIRTSKDHAKVWLVARGVGELEPRTGRYDPARDHVIASLDTRTGAFIGENGVIMDPRLPLEEQEAAGMQRGQPGQPGWATSHGGILLRRLQLR